MSARSPENDPVASLRKWVRTGDELAFRAVVEAYAGMVFHTARQRLNGDTEAAREVTQNVFILAARKAPQLIKLGGLSAWFHSTAMKESANHRRAEERRRKRQERYALNGAEARESSAGPGDAPEADLRALRVHLDEALHSLKPAEREILLSRYFENHTFAAIAEAQGSSPDAVRMRCQRALERLSARLRRHGLTAGSLTLAAALTAQWTRPAPEQLTASICSAISSTSAAAAATASTSAFTLMASAKSLTATAAVLLLAFIPLHRQNERLRELETTSSAATASLPTAARSSKSITSRGHPGSVSLIRGPANAPLPIPLTAEGLMKSWMAARNVRTLENELWVPDQIWKEREAILKLSTPELQGLLVGLDAAPAGEYIKSDARVFLIQIVLGGRDPRLALETALEERLNDAVLKRIAQQWAASDPVAAQAWLEKRRDEGRLAPARFGEDPESKLWSGITQAIAAKDPAAAADWVQASLETAEAPALLRGLAPVMANEKWQDRFLDLAARMPSPEAALEARGHLLAHVLEEEGTTQDPSGRGRGLLDNPRVPPDQREALLLKALHIRAAGEDGIRSGSWIFSEAWSLTAPERRRDVLLKLLKDHEPGNFSGNSQRMASHEAAVAEIARALADEEPARSRRYIKSIDDPFLRESLQTELAPYLQKP